MDYFSLKENRKAIAALSNKKEHYSEVQNLGIPDSEFDSSRYNLNNPYNGTTNFSALYPRNRLGNPGGSGIASEQSRINRDINQYQSNPYQTPPYISNTEDNQLNLGYNESEGQYMNGLNVPEGFVATMEGYKPNITKENFRTHKYRWVRMRPTRYWRYDHFR